MRKDVVDEFREDQPDRALNRAGIRSRAQGYSYGPRQPDQQMIISKRWVDSGNLDKGVVGTAIDLRAGYRRASRQNFDFLGEVVEKAHAIEIPHGAHFTLVEDQPDPTHRVGELVSDRQQAYACIYHHLTVSWEVKGHRIKRGVMRSATTSQSQLKPSCIDPTRGERDNIGQIGILKRWRMSSLFKSAISVIASAYGTAVEESSTPSRVAC